MGRVKVAIWVILISMMIGIVIGVAAVLRIRKEATRVLNSPAMRIVDTVCEPTAYKESCVASLRTVANNASATPHDYILAIVNATLEEVNKAIAATGKVAVDDKDKYDQGAKKDCEHMLDFAVDLLESTVAAVHCGDRRQLEERQHELLSWITAVYAFQTTCTDNIRDPDYKSAVQNGMINATQLTHNAVNVVAELSKMLEKFGDGAAAAPPQAAAPTAANRRLLGLKEGFPYWFGAAERRLLAAALVPNVVVAADGSGDYKSIMEAVEAYPKKFEGRFLIYVKAGVYKEKVVVDKKKPNIMIYGDGINKTIVTGSLNVNADKNIGTMNTATFANEATGFIARGMTFRNEAGPEGHQAVAFRSVGDKTALFDCSFEAYQDTLYYQNLRQFYKNCRIYGTIDFIFGKGDCVIQDSEIIVRRPMPDQFNTVTADGREIPRGSNGLVLHHCKIIPDNVLWPQRFETETYLGRPWTAEARTVVMQSTIGDFVRPEGYKIWDGEDNHKTCEMMEYGNEGPGASTDGRNKEFSKFRVLDAGEAAKYSVGEFLGGGRWLPVLGVPAQMGLY